MHIHVCWECLTSCDMTPARNTCTPLEMYMYIFTQKLYVYISSSRLQEGKNKKTFELWALSFERAFEIVTPSGIGCTSQGLYMCIYSQEMCMYISMNITRHVYVHVYIHPKRCIFTSLVACMYISRDVYTSCGMTPTREMYIHPTIIGDQNWSSLWVFQ